MRLALLTGGSKGLELALSEVLGSRGYKVIEFSRTAPHQHSVHVDLASPPFVHRVVAETLASVDPGELNDLIVINNAATIEPIGPTHGKTADAIIANLNTNFTSPVLFISDVIARFQTIPCRKVLANISAGVAHKGLFGWSLYCAAKVAMESFIHSLAIEQQGEPFPFIPISVDPGVIDTDMHAIAGAASLSDFPAGSRFLERRAIGQLTPPVEIATAIVRLLVSTSLIPGRGYDARADA